jgi:MOSC domain-containing protein YiiM
MGIAGEPVSGTVEGIFTAAEAGQPLTAVSEITGTAGRGLEGDRYATGRGNYSERPGGGRHLTLIEAEVLDWLASEHGIQVAPNESRRNLLTSGVRLNDLVGRRFRVGALLCQGIRLCEPCAYLEQLTGKSLTGPLVHRAGLRAEILEGGTLRIGDPIEPV